MRMEIFDDKKKDEPVLRLRLHQDEDSNVIDLMSVYKNGDREKRLLQIQPDGSITRTVLNAAFIEKYNLSVDERYKLKVHE